MLRFLTAGESHGPALTLIVEGLPAGLAVEEEAVNAALARRQAGYGRGGRMLIEKDRAQFTAGVRFGKTLGTPVGLTIPNRDWANWLDDMALFGPERHGRDLTRPRPGHADLAGMCKYAFADARPVLERASARNTATQVAAGALASALLDALGLEAAAHVRAVGEVKLPDAIRPSPAEIKERAGGSDFFCVCEKTAAKMRAAVDAAKASGDSLGGLVEVVGDKIIPGLGSYAHWDRRIDGLLAQAVMSIPAFKAVEIGDGQRAAEMPGSLVHDEVLPAAGGGVRRASNRAGGVEGGMTNGERLIVRGYMKPIPTLTTPLRTVDVLTGEAAAAASERSDTCAVPAAAAVAEAMVKWVLAAAVLEKFSADNMGDLNAAVKLYRERLKKGGCAPCG
ncbi:MAG: chorismate synthase [Acidaminococcales bacterium]|jgi:chorismate synthase|nr:chorismate synthase [Acidaminococcales bacterium]